MTEQESGSPHWSGTTKLVVALTLVALLAGLLVSFQQFLGPLLGAFVLAYLADPIARFLNRKLRFNWGLAVGVIYITLLLLALGVMAAGGLAAADQIQNLIAFLQKQIVNLPSFIEDVTHRQFLIGPFTFDFSTLNIDAIGEQVLKVVQPLLSNLGGLFGSVASGAASTLAWMFFTWLVSYFVLAETKGEAGQLIKIRIPGYANDIRRLGEELSKIWNAFLRGQLLVFVITVVIYIIVLGLLGVKYYYALAVLAGLARFLPYVGPWITWITYGLVTYFQGSTIFGMLPLPYVILVIGTALLTDVILDNYMVPRLIGDALRVHPAAVMVAALISAQLFGLVGMVLAAPVLASLLLILEYATNKLFDLEPWRMREPLIPKPIPKPILKIWHSIRTYARKFWNNLKKKPK